MSRAVTGARWRARALAWGALAVLATPGCARYRAAPAGVVPEGARVRVLLTDAGTAALAPTAAGPGVVGLEGEWVGARDDTVRVRAVQLLTSAGVPVAWGGPGGTEVAVPRAGVRGVERRTTDRGRTALVAAGAVAAAVAFLAIVRNAGRGGGGGGEGGITPF